MDVIVHHDEIGLKKGNFHFFEKKLVKNIELACKKQNISLKNIVRKNKRLLCSFDGKEDKDKISKTLEKVFGIEYFAFVEQTEKSFTDLEKHIKKIYNEFQKEGIKEIAFQTKRSDKKFHLNSVEINKKLGEFASDYNLSFNYGNPEKIIYIEIVDKIYIYTKRHKAYGGLPIGTGGKVLCLISGGIDSPIAAWMMMKRGCQIDFLHFHAFSKNKKITEETNVVLDQIKKLNNFQHNSKLYVLPYSTYQLNVEGKIFPEYDLVLFKHYMLKVAERIALKKGYNAIITGDNLAQVASQTIENLKVTGQNIDLPIFRPLIGMNKQEIINLSKEIGLYKTSIQKYKDCCSIISKNPSTKTKAKKFDKELEKIDFESLIKKSLKEISMKKIN